MKNKKQFRQGDVLIEYVDELPKDAVKQTGRVILAHGEVTGHAHEVDMADADGWKHGDTMHVTTKRKTTVRHQKHAPIPLKRKKIAKVTRQKEYTPAAIRNVAD